MDSNPTEFNALRRSRKQYLPLTLIRKMLDIHH
uniref:Uncharacterized protein n=1 Tax=Rhizophora mucronata TaxID=61149 RepID=A0A2P2N081_RHIMU